MKKWIWLLVIAAIIVAGIMAYSFGFLGMPSNLANDPGSRYLKQATIEEKATAKKGAGEMKFTEPVAVTPEER